MLTISLEEIRPLLPGPLAATDEPRATAWISAMSAILHGRYGDRITDDLRPAVLPTVADAVARRVAKRNQMADSEAAGPFNVRWNADSATGGWFLPNELADLDRLFGRGGSRTYRTPAPDEIRALNRMPLYDVDDIGYVDLPWPGGHHVG